MKLIPPARSRRWLALPGLMLALIVLACAQFGPQPTVPPPPAANTASPTPGPETPTPRPEALTQPAVTEAASGPTPVGAGTPLPVPAGEAFAPVAAIGPEIPGSVLALAASPDGNLWLLTDRAVARLVGETWEIFLPEYEGELAGLDAFNRVWVAAPNGTSIEVWDGTAWQTFGAGEGWLPVSPSADGSVVVGGLAADLLGQVWVATAADVRAFDGEQWHVFDRAALGLTPAATDSSARFRVHVARRDGTVWVSQCDVTAAGPTGGGGIRFFDGEQWQGEGTPLGVGCGGALASSPQGRVWMGLDDLVLEYDPDSGEFAILPAPPPPTGERFGEVADLAVDLLDRPWPLMTLCNGASCDAGMVRYWIDAEGTWTQVGDVSAAQQTLLFDTAGGGWLLSEAGAQRITPDGQVQTAGDLRLLASAADSFGQLYVVGEQGGALGLYLLRPGGE